MKKFTDDTPRSRVCTDMREVVSLYVMDRNDRPRVGKEIYVTMPCFLPGVASISLSTVTWDDMSKAVCFMTVGATGRVIGLVPKGSRPPS